MNLDAIRAMITRYETVGDPQGALSASRTILEDTVGTDNSDDPELHVVRLYAQVVRGLCLIRIAEPDDDIAVKLEMTAIGAMRVQLSELAMLANWYAACCRLMRFVARGEDRQDHDRVLMQIAQCFHAVSQQAAVLEAWRLRAVAMSLAVECAARQHNQPHNLVESATGTLATLREVRHDGEGSIASRIEQMERIVSGQVYDFPTEATAYTHLLYRPGSLESSLRRIDAS